MFTHIITHISRNGEKELMNNNKISVDRGMVGGIRG